MKAQHEDYQGNTQVIDLREKMPSDLMYLMQIGSFTLDQDDRRYLQDAICAKLQNPTICDDLLDGLLVELAARLGILYKK